MERTGTVRSSLPPCDAFPLFTPEGERDWVEGWVPIYPAWEGGPPAPAPGLTFVVSKPEGPSTWIVTDFDEQARTAAYVYVLPGHRATTVEVEVEHAPEGGSLVRVTYRITSLAPEGDAFVQELDAGWDGFLEEWERAIDRHIVRGQRLGGPV